PIHTVMLHKQAVAAAVRGLRPSARCEVFNEDLGIDWVWVDRRLESALAPITAITPNPSARQLDPERADFFYDAPNLGFPPVTSEPPFAIDPGVRQPVLRAASNDVRILGASMIAVIPL